MLAALPKERMNEVYAMNKTKGLLDHLAELTGVEYLSDLKHVDYEHIRALLPKIEIKRYPLHQWLDASDYLTGTKPETNTVQELYEYLLHYIKH